ncbi:MAG: alpha/beta fold hydrolase [Promethearchaeota archaeon]
MPKVKINTMNIYYEIYGTGPPLLMILGLGANVTWWGKYFIKRLADHFKVITFDNRGTGQSSNPKSQYTVKTLADDACGLLKALNIGNTYVFGHSMGGGIAQELVIEYSGTSKLILCNSSCGGSKSILASPEVLEIVDKTRSGRTPVEIAKESLKIFYSPEFIENHPKLINYAVQNMAKSQMLPRNYEWQTAAIKSFKTCDRLKNIKIPTLIMHGAKDALVPPQNAKILAELIPNANIKMFTESAHAPYVEEPDAVIGAMVEFLL